MDKSIFNFFIEMGDSDKLEIFEPYTQNNKMVVLNCDCSVYGFVDSFNKFEEDLEWLFDEKRQVSYKQNKTVIFVYVNKECLFIIPK